jgi:predicted DNA-binding protein (UPF0251 family)
MGCWLMGDMLMFAIFIASAFFWRRNREAHKRLMLLAWTQVAKKHGISRASVCRLMKEATGKAAPAVLVPDVSIRQEAHV